MKKLKDILGQNAGTGARLIAGALVLGTACSWYSILKPELIIKRDDSGSLRRRIEAAVQPGHDFVSSPVLIRTANNHYLVTIQENQATAESYKAELTDYLKGIAQTEAKAELDVVFAKSPALFAKSAVASIFKSPASPIVIGFLFLILVRFFFAPVSNLVQAFSVFVDQKKKNYVLLRGEAREAHALSNLAAETHPAQPAAVNVATGSEFSAQEMALGAAYEVFDSAEKQVALAHAQRLLDVELSRLQAEADLAFTAQAEEVRVSSVAEIMAKLSNSKVSTVSAYAAPVVPRMPLAENEMPATFSSDIVIESITDPSPESDRSMARRRLADIFSPFLAHFSKPSWLKTPGRLQHLSFVESAEPPPTVVKPSEPAPHR